MTPKTKAVYLASGEGERSQAVRLAGVTRKLPESRTEQFNLANTVPEYTLEDMRAMLRPDKAVRKFRFPTH